MQFITDLLQPLFPLEDIWKCAVVSWSEIESSLGASPLASGRRALVAAQVLGGLNAHNLILSACVRVLLYPHPVPEVQTGPLGRRFGRRSAGQELSPQPRGWYAMSSAEEKSPGLCQGGLGGEGMLC